MKSFISKIGKQKIIVLMAVALLLIATIAFTVVLIQKNLNKETFTVKFDFNYNVSIDTVEQKILKGDFAVEPEIPSRDGYVFYGWLMYPDVEAWSQNPADLSTFSINEDITFYAIWYSDEFDEDGDGLSHANELLNKTDAFKYDTDSDGISDGDEVNNYNTNPCESDSDGDGIADGTEVALKLNPLNSHSDGVTHDTERKLEAVYEDFEDLFELKITSKVNMLSTVSVQTFDNDVISDPTGLISPVFDVQYDKQHSFDSAELIFNYSDADLSEINEDDLTFLYINEKTGKYEVISSVVDKEKKIIVAKPTHFSAYVVGDKKSIAESVSFNISKISVTYDNETYYANRKSNTGFDVKKHGFAFSNFASNVIEGNCAGFTFVSYLNFMSKLPIERNGYIWKLKYVSGYDLTTDSRYSMNNLYNKDEIGLFSADTSKNVDAYPFPDKLKKLSSTLDCIKYWSGKQAERDFQKYTDTVNSNIEFYELYNRLKFGEPVPLALAGLDNEDKKAFHYVLAYDIFSYYYDGTDYYFIPIYDSNYPGALRYILAQKCIGESISYYVEYITKSVSYYTIRIAEIPNIIENEDQLIKHNNSDNINITTIETTVITETTLTPETTIIPEIIQNPETTEIPETLPPMEQLFTVTGKVVKFDGKTPHVGATVNISNDLFEAKGVVDNNGYFSVEVPNGDYRFSITAQESADNKYTFISGWGDNFCHIADSGVDLGTFKISTVLRGMVTEGTPGLENYGKPLEGVKVSVLTSNEQKIIGESFASNYYDSSGNKSNYGITFNSPGTYDLIFSKEGYQDFVIENYVVDIYSSKIPEVFLINTDSETTEHVHTYTSTDNTASCTEEVKIIHTCPCGDSYTEILPMIEHNFVNNVCSMCGYVLVSSNNGLEIKVYKTYCEIIGIGICKDKNIVLPDTYQGLPVTMLSDEVFYNCDFIESVYIPASIIEITGSRFTNSPFRNCPNLERIEVDPENTVFHSSGNCLIITERKLLIAGCKNSILPNDGSVKTLGFTAFMGCNIERVIIPDSVTVVGMSAFYKCNNLKYLYLTANSMNTLDAPIFLNRFSSCPIKEVVIADDFTDLEKLDFNTLKSLTVITLGKGISVIKSNDFSRVSELTTLNLNNTIERIEENAFVSCSNLTAINFNGTLEQWEAINKNNGWDSGIGNYTVYCLDGKIKK